LADSFQIAGVVQDVKYFGLANASEPSLYFSVYQAPFRRMHYTLRTSSAPAALMPLVRREVGAVDPSVPISRVEMMERIVSNSVARERFSMLLLTIFAGCALLLAAVGIYGVISYSVSQRTAELGIRMAVGANAAEVLRLVMGQAAMLAGWGVAVGIAGAMVLSRVMANQLYGISALDPTTFVSVSFGLVAVALLAAFIPALRAARIDPVVALQGADASQ
jgi:putative ABC transport system permease protein